MSKLKIGDKVKIKNGGEAKILSEFGAGGQGTVYKVSYEGKDYALKWYHDGVFRDKAHNFYNNLQKNISNGAPTSSFLWPLSITEVVGGTFGYLMDIRPSGYEELTNFFVGTKKKPQVHFISFDAVCNAAINIVEAFRELHNRGYSYQDINNGNFFISPTDGKVLICDNDNVSPDITNLGIMGKQRWMAPEIVTGKNDPDTQSDRFSLAVVLFRLLFINHPLEGEYSTPPCMTKDLEKKYYGTDPVFVYDPTNRINKPVPGTDKTMKLFWERVYPQYIKDLFIRAFSNDVMQKKASRVLEKEWLNAFTRLKAEIGTCPYCKNEMFYTVLDNSGTVKCMECGKSSKVNNYVKIGLKTYPVFKGMRLSMWDVDNSLEDIRTPVAEVMANPNNPSQLGFMNTGKETWVVALPDGSTRPVPPGKPVPVKSGFEIKFRGNNGGEGRVI